MMGCMLQRGERQKRDWEALGRLDPFWAVLTDPAGQHNQWDLDEFYDVGEQQTAALLDHAAEHGLPQRREVAVDFGCGTGRVTRALSSRFGRVIGVDLSAPMIELARTHAPQAEYLLQSAPGLPLPDDSVDFVFSWIALQHIKSEGTILEHVAEFSRVLRPGGLLVDPDSRPSPVEATCAMACAHLPSSARHRRFG